MIRSPKERNIRKWEKAECVLPFTRANSDPTVMASRLKQEVKMAMKARQEMLSQGIDYRPRDVHDLSKWVIYLKFLDKNSPYFGQTYEVDVLVPPEYPFKHPQCRFVSHIFHPNIDANTGKICLNIINDNNTEWTTAQNIQSIAIGLQSLVYGPNCDSPLNLDAGCIFRYNDHRCYKSMVDYFYTLNRK